MRYSTFPICLPCYPKMDAKLTVPYEAPFEVACCTRSGPGSWPASLTRSLPVTLCLLGIDLPHSLQEIILVRRSRIRATWSAAFLGRARFRHGIARGLTTFRHHHISHPRFPFVSTKRPRHRLEKSRFQTKRHKPARHRDGRDHPSPASACAALRRIEFVPTA